MGTVCEVCGDVGFRHLLVSCRDCKCSAVHQYCWDNVVFDGTLLADWVCDECLQRRGEVTRSGPLVNVSSEEPPSHTQFGSTVHQLITKRVECAGSWRYRKIKPSMTKYAFLNKVNISQMKRTKKKSSMQPMGYCADRKGRTPSSTPIGNGSLESNDLQASPGADYVLSYKSYLSQAQKERVMALIQETQPEITVFVAMMQKSNVNPPGPFLSIPKEYAIAHFPHESRNVTLEMPGKSKKWHPLFYKRNESRKNMLVGQWLDFVHDNCVQEGDICILLPTKDESRSTFTVYLLSATATHSSAVTDLRIVRPCATATHSSAKMASEVHIKQGPKPTNGVHGCSVKETFEEFIERSLGDPSDLYIVACRSNLSPSQVSVVEERVEAIQSEFPIYVAVMKNNNAGVAQRWMLEIGVKYAAAIHLPACGRTVMLHCEGKTWETQMVIHNGRRWFLNGGWTKFARDNGLRVGDICLFELKKGTKLTMEVHIICKEQYLV